VAVASAADAEAAAGVANAHGVAALPGGQQPSHVALEHLAGRSHARRTLLDRDHALRDRELVADQSIARGRRRAQSGVDPVGLVTSGRWG
jgi:hypothetical protein